MKSSCESISANIPAIHGANLHSLSSPEIPRTPHASSINPIGPHIYGIAYRVKYLVDTLLELGQDCSDSGQNRGISTGESSLKRKDESIPFLSDSGHHFPIRRCLEVRNCEKLNVPCLQLLDLYHTKHAAASSRKVLEAKIEQQEKATTNI